ncbi:MAG: hypothetical protein JXB88_02045 [Spirochaetales bacterium]|nr:hypothetical protein [Spirochaetales bacterium]
MEKKPYNDFDTLFAAYKWKPIYGCTGRFILREKNQYTIAELTQGRVDIKTFSTDRAQDMVCIVIFDNGGIISYKKDDGSYVHTLNNKDGFIRKLKMLDLIQIVNNKGEA